MRSYVLALASLNLTPFGLALLGVATVAVYQIGDSATPWLAGPLFLLAANLIAAVATNGAFRRQLPLLSLLPYRWSSLPFRTAWQLGSFQLSLAGLRLSAFLHCSQHSVSTRSPGQLGRSDGR